MRNKILSLGTVKLALENLRFAEDFPGTFGTIAERIGIEDTVVILYLLNGLSFYVSGAMFARDGQRSKTMSCLSADESIKFALKQVDDAEDLPEPFDLLAKHIGVEKAVTAMYFLKGMNCYIPGSVFREAQLKQRNKNIITEFSNNNYSYLSKKYGVSKRWVVEIIKRQLSDFKTVHKRGKL